MTIIHFFNWSQNGSSFFLSFSLFSLSLFLSLSGNGHWPSLASNQKQTDSLQNSFLVPIYHRKFRRTFERNLVINRLSVKLSFATYLSFLSWSELLKQSLVFWTQYSPFWYLIYHFEFELNFRNKTWFFGQTFPMKLGSHIFACPEPSHPFERMSKDGYVLCTLPN